MISSDANGFISTHLGMSNPYLMTKKELVRQFLLAWQDLNNYRKELMPILAKTLGTAPQDIFYQKILSSSFQYSGALQETKWTYFFHGIADCDLNHVEDGRFIQIKFGPRGRFDTFSGWGTMLFIMASTYPWPDYPELKQYLAKETPLYTYLSGSHRKMLNLIESIERLGLFEAADKELTRKKIELHEKYSHIDGNGQSIFSPPAPYNDFTSTLFWDLQVCDTWVLSEQGKRLLFAENLDSSYFSKLWDEQIGDPKAD